MDKHMTEKYYRSIAWGFRNGTLYEYLQDNDRFYSVSKFRMGTDTKYLDTPEEARAEFWNACKSLE